jgi:hypothetical protein
MIDGITLGAYAIEPAPEVLASREREWYEKLGAIDSAHGLEVPYRAGLHTTGAPGLAAALPAHWHVVVTMLPATMAGIRADQRYGLASPDDDGRAAALGDVRAALAESHRLDELRGEQTVRAIHLTSAPRGTGDAGRLAASLEGLAAEANAIELLIEHCDAWKADEPVAKGFLSLDEETDAVLTARANTDATLGQVINWGRSAIEGRSADEPVRHLAALQAAGTLAGLMFSGTAATASALGDPWADAHNPLDSVDPVSLLTTAAIAAALTDPVLSQLSVLGVKVQDPERSENFDERLAALRTTNAAVVSRLREITS